MYALFDAFCGLGVGGAKMCCLGHLGGGGS